MVLLTPRQAIPYPQSTDDPDVPGDMAALAALIDRRLFGVYLTAADRNTRNTTPEEGQIAYVKDVDTIYIYTTTWTQLWPYVGLPSVTSGTTVPSNSSGANGDIYFQV